MTFRNRTDHDGSRRVVGLVVGALVAILGLTLLPSAGAVEQAASAVTTTTCDQAYGCGTTTTEPPPAATCGLSATSVTAGDTVIATVTNVPVGDEIQITFDGSVIASAESTAGGGAQISFRVPSTTATGIHEVRAIGEGFNANCAAEPTDSRSRRRSRNGRWRQPVIDGHRNRDLPRGRARAPHRGWQLVLIGRRRLHRQAGSRRAGQRQSIRN